MAVAQRGALAERSDEELLRFVSEQNMIAYETLYDRHAQTVYNLIARIVRDMQVADELLQETFWQIWQNAGQYRGDGAAAAWILRIARNRALDQLRRQKTQPRFVGTTLEDVADRTNHKGAEYEAEQMWNRQHVRIALESLPYEQRLCIELAYFEGLSQQEIARNTNMALGTVKSRIRLGMEKLERLLRIEGYP